MMATSGRAKVGGQGRLIGIGDWSGRNEVEQLANVGAGTARMQPDAQGIGTLSANASRNMAETSCSKLLPQT